MSPRHRPVAVHRVLSRSLALALAGAAFADASVAQARESRPRPAASMRNSIAPAPVPDGASFTLTSCADSGPGTLRQAMLDAHNNTTIDFDQLACSTITLTTGALTDPNTDSLHLIATPLVVGGRPVPRVTIDGGGASRIIEHRSGGQLELQGLAFRNGDSNESRGGCIYSMGQASLTAVTVRDCRAVASGSDFAAGGGIWSNDEVDLVFSTISGNSAVAAPGGYAYGGGVFTGYGLYAKFSTIENNEATGFGYGGGAAVAGFAAISFSMIASNRAAYGAGLSLFGGDVGPGDVRIRNSTIAANHASGFAGGIEAICPLEIYNSTIAFNLGDRADSAAGIVMQGSFSLDLVSTIVARNEQAGVNRDLGGSGSLGGSANLVMSSTFALPPDTLSVDPMLVAAIGDYGGQTSTLRLQPGSPAIDHGSNPTHLLCDQRGGNHYAPPYNFTGLHERQLGSAVDIGAFESGTGDTLFQAGFESAEPVECDGAAVQRAPGDRR